MTEINKGVVAINEALDRFSRASENIGYANGNGLIGKLLEVYQLIKFYRKKHLCK